MEELERLKGALRAEKKRLEKSAATYERSIEMQVVSTIEDELIKFICGLLERL